MGKDKRFLQMAGVLFFLVITLSLSHRLWARQIIIDDIEITEESGCSEILVTFSFPVRYIKHFPYELGDDLRITIRPIVTGSEERDAIFSREPVVPPPNELAGLTKLVYEGDLPDGPFLTLFFDQVVAYQVGQGDDYRSLIIVVTAPDNPETCHIKQ